MKQVILSEEEQNDIASALEQVVDLYEMKASELERNIRVAESRIVDLRSSKETVNELKTKVTLAEEFEQQVDMEVTDEPIPPEDSVFTPTHTICMCDYCVHLRQSLITDDSIEQME
jgi:hypothetical protein